MVSDPCPCPHCPFVVESGGGGQARRSDLAAHAAASRGGVTGSDAGVTGSASAARRDAAMVSGPSAAGDAQAKDSWQPFS